MVAQPSRALSGTWDRFDDPTIPSVASVAAGDGQLWHSKHLGERLCRAANMLVFMSSEAKDMAARAELRQHLLNRFT